LLSGLWCIRFQIQLFLAGSVGHVELLEDAFHQACEDILPETLPQNQDLDVSTGIESTTSTTIDTSEMLL
jgi:hypothetical protein